MSIDNEIDILTEPDSLPQKKLDAMTSTRQLLPYMLDDEINFCNAYIETSSIMRAVHRLDALCQNPSEKARQITARPIVAKFLELRRKELVTTFITKDDVLMTLKHIQEKSLEDRPIFDKNGRETGYYEADTKTAVAATKLLGEALGMFKDKQDGKTEGPIMYQNINIDKKAIDKFKKTFNTEF